MDLVPVWGCEMLYYYKSIEELAVYNTGGKFKDMTDCVVILYIYMTFCTYVYVYEHGHRRETCCGLPHSLFDRVYTLTC